MEHTWLTVDELAAVLKVNPEVDSPSLPQG
jgi:hypothetical protein